MKFRWLTFFVGLAFVAAVTSAHGNKVHIKGHVEKIGADSLQIRIPDGKIVEVKLLPSTVYVLHVAPKTSAVPDANEDKPAKLADLAVGDAVVIHARPKGETLEADEVRFSSGSNKIASPAAKPKS